MSRVLSRVLAVTAISGIAIAPAMAYAADGAPTPHEPTVTRVHAPKNAHGGQDILLSARVSIATQPTAPTTDQGSGKGSKSGKGHGGKKGKGKGHRHPTETGSITFVVDGKSLPPVKVLHGRALEKLALPPGNHSATASYSGDDNYDPSQSMAVTFAVS